MAAPAPMPETTALRSPRLARALAIAVAAAALAACSTTDLTGDTVDYRSKASKTSPLEVPPDLTQLQREARFTPQAGTISATTYQGAGAATAPAATPAPTAGAGHFNVAVVDAGPMRVEREGDQRWLVTSMTPEELWPKIRTFWETRGFVIAYENAEAGLMETDWAENRARIPGGIIRDTIGRALDTFYSTGERDKFRTRIERTATGSEVYITHRGLIEVFVTQDRTDTRWTGRPSDPQLEADQLARLMTALGTPPTEARTAVAQAPERPPRARALADQPGAALQVDENFDRAWRRVGVALDRTGFTVEDRDRASGVYFVRYITPEAEAKAQPGLVNRMFGITPTPPPPTRYRIAVKGDGDDRTIVSVLDARGAPEASEVGQRIVSVLVADLK
ncbi:MAG: outer membrane protein assembly factor BamC [Burkholderiaceae bacterium]|nr:outer membrane protein assembly factor BamC [Burkholderiaceae bacterium]